MGGLFQGSYDDIKPGQWWINTEVEERGVPSPFLYVKVVEIDDTGMVVVKTLFGNANVMPMSPERFRMTHRPCDDPTKGDKA